MKASDYLDKEELKYFTRRSDLWGWWLVGNGQHQN